MIQATKVSVSFKHLLISILFGTVGFQAVASTPGMHKKNGWSTRGCTHGDSGLSCARYLRNYDGDTITFDIPNVHPLLGHEILVRVKGIDTPELRTKDECEKRVAEKAQRIVQAMLTNAERVDLLNAERGKYFRVLADIFIDGRSLAENLIKQGLAVPYDGGSRSHIDWCGK